MPILNIANDHNSPAISRGLLKCPPAGGRSLAAQDCRGRPRAMRKVRELARARSKHGEREQSSRAIVVPKKTRKENKNNELY